MSDFKQPKNPRRQIANVGLVLLIHAALGYAVVTGLGHSVIRALDTETELRVIRDIKPVDMPPPLLAPPKLLPPPPASFVVPPIEIATPPQSPSRPLAAEPESIAPVSRKPEEIQPRPPLRVAPVIDAAQACQMPQYPAVSIRLAEQGVVDLEFLIDVDGRVAGSRIAASSGHDRLDQAARGALALCKFAPGTVDGKPERSWAHIRYRWTLAQ